MDVLRTYVRAEDEEQPAPYSTFHWVGRGLMVSSLILFFLRIFHFYELSEQLGPKVLMVGKMVRTYARLPTRQNR